MKFCEECGAQLEADAVFCEECGAQVDDTPLPTPVVPEKKQKKSKLPILIGAIGGAVLIAVIVIVVVVVLKKRNDEIPIVNSETTTKADEVNTTLDKEETEPTKEKETETSITEDKYLYLDDFVEAVSYVADWGLGYITDEAEIERIYKEAFDEWYNGEGYDWIVADEDGRPCCELFMNNEYGVYTVYDRYIYDFALQIIKQNSNYSIIIAVDRSDVEIYRFDITNEVIAVGRDNLFEYNLENEDGYTIRVTFNVPYSPYYSECDLEINIGSWSVADNIISNQNVEYRTFDNYTEFSNYLYN